MEDLFLEAARYRQGEMTPEEQSLFEQKLKQSPELQKDLELFEDLKEVLVESTSERKEDLEEFRQVLKKTGESYHAQQAPVQPNNSNGLRYGLFVAAAAILAALVWFIWKNTSEQPPKLPKTELYAHAYPNKLVNIMNNTDSQSWGVEYEKGNFEKAVSLILNIPEGDRTPQMDGVMIDSYTKLGNFDKALTEIGKLTDKDDADWWLAGVYLKQGKYEECKKIYERLSEKNGSYAGKAKEILERYEF